MKPDLRIPTARLRSAAPAFAAALLAFALALLAGCFFDGGEAKGGSWEDFPNPQANQCGDITPAQMQQADKVLAGTKGRLDGELGFFLSDSVEDWEKVKRRDLPSIKAQYAGALKAAPNHCGALFGHAVATAFSVLQDNLLDTLVDEAGESGDFGGLPGLAKLAWGPELAGAGSSSGGPLGKASASEDGGASRLILLKRGLASADKSLLTLIEQFGEKSLLPRLDTAIQQLEKVNRNPDFRFVIGVDGDTVRLDRGELAPILGSMKFLKAALFVMVGYQWRIEDDEDYPMYNVIDSIGEDDFDNLTPAQRQALTHYTDLLKAGNRFSRIRPGWEARIASIPTLLLEVVEHVQEGLRYGILQAQQGQDQSKDPYVVGTGEGADVDPADHQRAIDYLERSKKYLKGELPVTFANGGDTLKVDVPKLFRVNGLQTLLPRFGFYDFEAWNDTVVFTSDTVVTEFDTVVTEELKIRGPVYFTDAVGDTTLHGWELEDIDSIGALAGKVVFPDPTFGGVLPGMTNERLWRVIQSIGDEGPRSREACVTDPQWPDWQTCESRLPIDPSDLDIIWHYLLGTGL